MTIDPWPELPLAEWNDTLATLHMWTQIVGKIRLKLSPLENHWWNVPLYVTARGLTTSAIPYNDRLFQIDFDFIDHLLIIETSNPLRITLAIAGLRSKSLRTDAELLFLMASSMYFPRSTKAMITAETSK